jgi:hypothetical protein
MRSIGWFALHGHTDKELAMNRSKLLVALLLGLAVCFSTLHASAQQPASPPTPPTRPAIAKLRQLIESIRSKLRPIDKDKVAKARESLQQKVERLDAYLTRNGENGSDWRTYLALENLKEAIAPDADVDPRIFGLFQNRFNAKHVGLEERPFADVADALREYHQIVIVSSVETPQELEKKLEPLVKLASLTGPASTDELYQASQALGMLEVTETAPEVVQAVRAEFSRPNLLFQAEESFVGEGIGKAVDQWSTDQSCKKKTFITSHTHTIASSKSEFVESTDKAVLRTILNGTAYTTSTAHAGPAIVNASATTQLFGQLGLSIDEFGIKAKCATACADTSICFTGFGSTKCGIVGRVVTRVASRQAPKQRAQNEQEANAKAAKKLAESLDDEAEKMVEKANQKYLDNVRLPLVRYNAFPRHFNVATTADQLTLTAQNDSRFQLGAPNEPPAAAGNDVTVRLHETFVNNMMASVFAGRRVTEEEMGEFFERLQTDAQKNEHAAKKRKDDGESKPWSIVFAEANPVTIEIDNNVVTLTIRGRRFESGNSKIDNTKIIARYTLSHVDGEVRAKRDAELYVIPIDNKIGDRVGGATTAQMGPLRKRLEGESGPSTDPVFAKEFTIKPVELKDNFAKLGTLVVRQFSADDGWLALGWKAEKPATTPSKAAVSSKSVALGQ